MGQHSKNEPKPKITLPKFNIKKPALKMPKLMTKQDEEVLDTEKSEEIYTEVEDTELPEEFTAETSQEQTAEHTEEQLFETEEVEAASEEKTAKKIKVPKISLPFKMPELKKKSGNEEPSIPNIQVPENVKSLSANNTFKFGRLVIAALIIVLIHVTELKPVFNVLLMILAFVAAGFKVVLDLIDDVDKGRFFTTNVVIVLSSVCSLFMNFAEEAVIMIIAYELCSYIVQFIAAQVQETAEHQLDLVDDGSAATIKEAIAGGDNNFPAFSQQVVSAADRTLKAASVIAVIYAIVLPIVTNYSIADSMHRALMVLLIATPVSVAAAIPAAGVNAMCYAATEGITVKKAATFLKACLTKTVIVDKTGIITAGNPKLLTVEPQVIDAETFITFAAHAVYYSEQSLFKCISDSFGADYQTEVISDFKDVHGYGVSLKIGGNQVLLGTSEMFANTNIMFKAAAKGTKYLYMTVAGRYVGCMAVSDGLKEDSYNLVNEIKEEGAEYFVLLSEDSEENNEMFSEYSDFDKVYNGLNVEGKINVIKDIMAVNSDPSVFVYTNGVESHSAADIDIRVNKRSKYADVLVDPENTDNIPRFFVLAHRTKHMLDMNALIAFIFKGILITAALTGNCTLWLAVVIDAVASIATIVNTSRIASEPKNGSKR